MIDRYDALVALRDFDLEKKRDLLIKIFNKEIFHAIKSEIVSQLSKDTSTASIDLFKRALNDKDFLVRRAAVDNIDALPDEIPAMLLPELEKLLKDTSYYTIENTLRKLCKRNPSKTSVYEYLKQVSRVYGINNNVRITWLEIYCEEDESDTGTYFHKQLVKYTSNSYEFRTRTKAIEALGRLNYCDEELIKNLFNACLSANSRLSNPASRILKTLLKKQDNLDKAKAIFALTTWKNWEKIIIEAQLK